MDQLLIAIDFRDPIWIAIAFGLGLAVRQVGLPPLVGFLIAGFVLNAFGAESGTFLHGIADFGVTLLLFTIGLKLDVRSLFKPEIWGAATAHIGLTVLIYALGLLALGLTGLSLAAGLDFTLAVFVAFALSFSSTVFAVKVLEEKGEMASRHGHIAIGILIIQDIAAVVFLAASVGKMPSAWAFALLALLPLRPVLHNLLERSGHGELLMLYGLVLALGGAALFEAVTIKGDLGALVAGLLIASHPKASELAKTLLSFKDVFLVGFFLSVGLAATPSPEAALIALLFVLALPVKVALYFWLMTRFRLRARTATLASLSLANYSEFGLIVGAIATSHGWLPSQWLAIIAVSLSLSFVLASPLNSAAHSLYVRFEDLLKRRERPERLPGDEPIAIGDPAIAIFGMGRVGTGAYDALHDRFGDTVVGIDFDLERVQAHREAGRNVLLGDATDPDFWHRLDPKHCSLQMALLAMPNAQENRLAAERIVEHGFKGKVAATSKYPDESEHLEKRGVDAVYNIYAEAGSGFARHVLSDLGDQALLGREARSDTAESNQGQDFKANVPRARQNSLPPSEEVV